MGISRLGDYRKETVTAVLAPGTRASISAALTGVQELAEAFDYARLSTIRNDIARCRALLESIEDSPALEPSLTACMDETHRTTTHVVSQRAAEQRETAGLVTAVREAVAAVSQDTATFQSDVQRSTSRFEELASNGRVLDLQARLRSEVQTLKTSIALHQAASRRNNESLNSRIASLETQLRVARQESAIDALTGVANRGAFDKACREWMTSGLLRFSVLMIDVDDFKQINDTQGHLEGDRVLAAVGVALQKGARSNQDFVARIGGDEFAILARDLTLTAADSLFSRVVATLDAYRKEQASSLPHVTLSCGAAEFSAGDTIRSLMQRADEALYEAKRRCKHRVVTKSKPFLRDL
ncbi:MAG: diguanylate cyclase [Acidobacteria bacterium]|nr:diguanylate cyclase [Acidobacteriota bacterium]